MIGVLLACLPSLQSCGGGGDICNCSPSAPDSADYRHDAKHIPIPAQTPQQIAVSTILSWPQPTPPAFTAPRSGRETQVFQIAVAYVQAVRLVGSDCDIHIEISQTADKTAPRVIVETPIDSEYCAARRNLQSQLQSHGVSMSNTQVEVTPAVPAQVTGMAFQDFEHNRGSVEVATTWELHPAIVSLSQ
jgi:hypothetical protein